MRRLPFLALAIVALAFPAGATARVQELGTGGARVSVTCPANCQALSRTTGYQGRAGALRNPFLIRGAGHIVAFTVTLGKPDARQVNYFTNDLGFGEPQVRLSILRKGKRRKTRLNHRLVRQSDIFPIERYYGSSPTFVLDEPLRVRKGYIVALTSPTWAPTFAAGTSQAPLGRSNWWRSSRQKGRCDNVSQRADQRQLGAQTRFGCTYFRARLLYTATYIPDPSPTVR